METSINSLAFCFYFQNLRTEHLQTSPESDYVHSQRTEQIGGNISRRQQFLTSRECCPLVVPPKNVVAIEIF